MEGAGMSRFLNYALSTWLLPFLGFLIGALVPLIVALFVGLDGFTFVACIAYGLVGALAGFIFHLFLMAFRAEEGR